MAISEREKTIVKKAMAFDLWELIDSNKEKTSYTTEELKQLLDDYIKAYTV